MKEKKKKQKIRKKSTPTNRDAHVPQKFHVLRAARLSTTQSTVNARPMLRNAVSYVNSICYLEVDGFQFALEVTAGGAHLVDHVLERKADGFRPADGFGKPMMSRE